jgi:hypothetical protein
VTLDVSTGRDWGNSVDVLPDDRIMIGGTAAGVTGYDTFVARFTANGTPDTTFNNGSSFIVTQVGALDDFGATIQVDIGSTAGDRVILGGTTLSPARTPNDFDFLWQPFAITAATVAALTVSDMTVVETDTKNQQVTFTLELSERATQDVVISYEFQGITATAGKDFTAKSGTVTIAKGQTSKTVSVTLLGNTDYQPNRTLSLVLRNVQNADPVRDTALLTIRDNDGTWQNVNDPEDVDGDGTVGTADVLRLVEELKRGGTRQLVRAASTPSAFVDINGDTLFLPQDILYVIQRIKGGTSSLGTLSNLMTTQSSNPSGLVASGVAAMQLSLATETGALIGGQEGAGSQAESNADIVIVATPNEQPTVLRPPADIDVGLEPPDDSIELYELLATDQLAVGN